MSRRTPLLPAITILATLLAVPVFAAQPSAPPGQQKDKPEKAPVTLHGTIKVATDADGKSRYTLTDGGTTYTLEAGPKWFFGDAYPLQKYVGKNVTVVGEVAAGSTEVDVTTVDGVALREPGKPPWAGGWKRVGSSHPGWSQEKADRMKAMFGDCFPPGQCKDKPARGGGGDKGPKASEAPGTE
jgi:hypothetical protein